MADEDLEYYIKFPSPTPKDSTPTSEGDEFVFLYDEEKLPVVILLGWAGCVDKHLAKYSSVYEDRGCITLRCTAPVLPLFLRHDKMPKLGERLLDFITDMSLEDHPIVFHCFSNGGAFFYQYISLAMLNRGKHLKVKGVILDSAPGERRLYSVYRALEAILSGPGWYRFIIAWILTALSYVFFMLQAIYSGLKEMKPPRMEPIFLVEEPFTWPQLFIYSKADQLVRKEDIEKFAKERKRRGIQVQELCFESSAHVQHLLQHREVYVNTVVSFIQDCLQNKQ